MRMGWAARVIAAIVFMVLGDVLLRVDAPGLGVALFAGVLAVAIALRYGPRLLHASGWIVVWVLRALGAAVDESVLGKVLLFALAWVILAYAMLPECDGLFTALVRGISGGLRSLGAGVVDARRCTLVNERQLSRRNLRRMPIGVYLIPIALVGLFAFLLIPANLALASWLNVAVEGFQRFLSDYSLQRFSFWIATGCVIYGLLRFRASRRRALPAFVTHPAPSSDDERAMELRASLLTFAGLNALYVLANLSDLLYLWLNVKLPAGVTYAEYAHQGSYRLIVAVVLAALTVMVFFRLDAPGLNDRLARMLAYLFIAQNLGVLAGACRRLALYIDVYGLTRFRVAAFLWMLLVTIGFVLIVMKLAGRRRIAFLLRWNTVATVLLLSAVALGDVDGAISNWNVGRLEAGESKAVDVKYLRELGPGALPALRRLSLRTDSVGSRAKEILELRTTEERELMKRWQNWTWRRSKVLATE